MPSPPPLASASRAGRPELDDLTLARAKRGDTAACRALVDRYQRAVFSMVRRMRPMAAESEREDLAQDIFLKVFTALPRFEIAGPARLSTWILTIATRRCIDEARRPHRTHVPLDDAAGLPAADASDASTQRRDQAAQINRALATLSDEQRAVVTLRMFAERTYDEIGAVLNLDVGTVKSRLSRAKTKMREALEEDAA